MPDRGTASVQVSGDRVRVTRWDLPPGSSTGPHRHEHDYVVVPVLAGRMEAVAQDGAVQVRELVPGESYARPAGVEHDVRNAGETLLSFVEVELLEPAQS